MFIAVLFIIAKRVKEFKCPSADKQISKMWYIYIKWNIIQLWKGMKFLHMLQHKWTLGMSYWMKQASCKGTNTVWFYLYEVPRAIYCINQSVQSLSRVWLCDPTDWGTPGFPVHHQLLELAQTHVGVGAAIRPSQPLLSPSIYLKETEKRWLPGAARKNKWGIIVCRVFATMFQFGMMKKF